MSKLIFTGLFWCLIFSSFSQAPTLLTGFKVSDDITRISFGIVLDTVSSPVASSVLSSTIISCTNTGCGVLPVQLLSFEAKRTSGMNVEVFWKTVNEFNNKEFVVQRSLSNSTGFSEVGLVEAVHFTSAIHEYTFNDLNGFEKTTYYRLKQVDFNNQFEYSRVVAVRGVPREEALVVYPNPASTEIILEVDVVKMEQVTLSLYNNAGKLILTEKSLFTPGRNRKRIDVTKFSKGMYLIEVIKDSGPKLSAKFIRN